MSALDNQMDLEPVDEPAPKPVIDWDADVKIDTDSAAMALTDESIGIRVSRTERYAIAMGKSIEKFTEWETATKTLNKISGNLLKQPKQAKFRKLNLENEKLQARLFKHKDCMNFLAALGFEKVGTELVMKKESDAVTQAAIRSLGKSKWERREGPIEPVARAPRIYTQELFAKQKILERSQSNIASASAPAASESSSYKDIGLLRDGAGDLMRRAKLVAPKEFMSKKFREEKYGVKKKTLDIKKIKKTMIRVTFPSKHTLECNFNPRESVNELSKFVATLVAPANAKFQFFLPPNQLLKPDQTFIKAGLINATVRIRCANQGFGLSKEVMEKYSVKAVADPVAKPLDERKEAEPAPAPPPKKKKVNKNNLARMLLRGRK